MDVTLLIAVMFYDGPSLNSSEIVAYILSTVLASV